MEYEGMRLVDLAAAGRDYPQFGKSVCNTGRASLEVFGGHSHAQCCGATTSGDCACAGSGESGDCECGEVGNSGDCRCSGVGHSKDGEWSWAGLPATERGEEGSKKESLSLADNYLDPDALGPFESGSLIGQHAEWLRRLMARWPKCPPQCLVEWPKLKHVCDEAPRGIECKGLIEQYKACLELHRVAKQNFNYCPWPDSAGVESKECGGGGIRVMGSMSCEGWGTSPAIARESCEADLKKQIIEQLIASGRFSAAQCWGGCRGVDQVCKPKVRRVWTMRGRVHDKIKPVGAAFYVWQFMLAVNADVRCYCG